MRRAGQRTLFRQHAQRNRRGRVARIAVHAATDRGKRDAVDAVLARQYQRIAMAGGEQRWLLGIAAMPYRPDRVDHETRGQVEAFCNARFAGRAAHAGMHFGNRPACGQQSRAGGAMDRTVDAATPEQTFIRRVDDRVDAQRGDVGLQYFDQAERCFSRSRISVSSTTSAGGAGGATSFFGTTRSSSLITMKIASAMIRKVMMVLMKVP